MDRGWTDSPAVQANLRAIGDVIRQEFGRDTSDYKTKPLARGYIGTAYEDATRTVVVVVDPELVDVQTLTDHLTAAAAGGDVSVRVGPGAFSAQELLQAKAVIDQHNWHPRAGQVSLGVTLNAAESCFDVTFGQWDDEVGEALEERLGDRVHVHQGAAPNSAGS